VTGTVNGSRGGRKKGSLSMKVIGKRIDRSMCIIKENEYRGVVTSDVGGSLKLLICKIREIFNGEEGCEVKKTIGIFWDTGGVLT